MSSCNNGVKYTVYLCLVSQALHLALSRAGSDNTKGSGKGKKSMQGSIDCLVGCISSDRTPYHVRCGLVEVLCLVENEVK